jgi:uncharacterized membrane protein YkgB
MLVRDPGPPTGELGRYYLSYGAGIDEDSFAEMMASADAHPPDVVYQDVDYADSDDTDPAYTNPDYADTAYTDTGYTGPAYADTGYTETGYTDTGYADIEFLYDGDAADEALDASEQDGWLHEVDTYRVDEYYPSYVTDLVRRVVDRVDRLPTGWMARYATRMIQISLGVIFTWFGVLKFFPGVSPAEGLVRTTVTELFATIGLESVPATPALIVLAGWEVLIGLGFLFDVRRRVVVWMLLLHMIGTALPLFLLPEVVWTQFPHALTLEGQYIIKNLALVGGAMAVGASSRPPADRDDQQTESVLAT